MTTPALHPDPHTALGLVLARMQVEWAAHLVAAANRRALLNGASQ